MPKMILREVTKSNLRWPYGKNEEVETLICDVEISGVTRKLHFQWLEFLQLYKCVSEKVFVRIPQYGTKRAVMRSDDSVYDNKVRRTNLYIQKTIDGYNFIQEYKVLDGAAVIIGWADDSDLEKKSTKASDNISPVPIRIDVDRNE